MACFAGCASIAGLDGITEQSCAPNCGTADSSVVESGPGNETGADTSVQNDTGPGSDTSVPPDSSSGGDSGMMDTGTIQDSPVDTFVWDGPPFDDAAFDSGCGSLNTTANCGACGNTCAPATMTQTTSQCCSAGICPGSTNGSNDNCKYTCANGHLDCNASIPPNSDGCECPAPSTASCCGTGCPVQHTDGLVGQSYYPTDPSFYDCVPLAAGVNSQLAQDACDSYVVARSGPANYCQPLLSSADATVPDTWCAATCNSMTGVCTGFMNDCICWTFSGQYMGQVLDPQAANILPASTCWIASSSVTFH